MPLFNHASTLGFAWWSPDEFFREGPDEANTQRALAGLLRRVRELVTEQGEASDALLAELPFDTFEEDDGDAEELHLYVEANLLTVALHELLSGQVRI